jgi:hypothetical protein
MNAENAHKLDVVALLSAAKLLLSERQNWTRETFARTRSGSIADPDERDARCWCALGAIRSFGADYNTRYAALETLEEVAPAAGVAVFNDDKKTKHKDVLALFDKAIAKIAKTLI